MSEFEDAVTELIGPYAVVSGEPVVRARDQWYVDSEALRGEVRDTLVNRGVPQASGQGDRGPVKGTTVSGWALPGDDERDDWFLDTEANLYTYYVANERSLGNYFSGYEALSDFSLTGPTTPRGGGSDLEAFRQEMVRRVAALIPRFKRRDDWGEDDFDLGDVTPLKVV